MKLQILICIYLKLKLKKGYKSQQFFLKYLYLKMYGQIASIIIKHRCTFPSIVFCSTLIRRINFHKPKFVTHSFKFFKPRLHIIRQFFLFFQFRCWNHSPSSFQLFFPIDLLFIICQVFLVIYSQNIAIFSKQSSYQYHYSNLLLCFIFLPSNFHSYLSYYSVMF